MARSWLDVLPWQDFEGMLQSSQHMTAAQGVRRYEANPIRGVSGPRVHLEKIRDKLKEYHAVDKRESTKIQHRRYLLSELSDLAKRYFDVYGVDRTNAAARATRRTTGSITKIERRDQKQASDESLDRNLLTLERRALRKRQYLQDLETHIQNTQVNDYPAFMRKLVEQDTSGGLFGVHKSNLYESEDFAHRSDEGGELANAFEQWAADPSVINMHFFLWLEGHPICLSQDRTKETYSGVTPVEYVTDPGNLSKKAQGRKFKLLALQNNLMIDVFTGQPMDTYRGGYVGSSQKSVNGKTNRWGEGIAAFVWAPSYEVYIAEHMPGRFHHSSLLAGGRVRCAGMIGIEAGKIKELSNDSGHYKPNLDAMKAFIQHHSRAFANEFIKVTFGPGAGIEGTQQQILQFRRFRDRPLVPMKR